MAEQKIEFRKLRDFGEILNDTFLFIRLNLKVLITSFFAICGIFLLGQAIFSGIYLSRIMGVLTQFRGGSTNVPHVTDIINGQYFFVWLFGWLSFTAMKVVLASYIKWYAEHNGEKPGIEEVWLLFKRYFLKVFFYSIPIILLIVIGYMFCILPGVYLTIVLLPFELVLVLEDASFSQAWDRCFGIIKDNFWISFAIYLIAAMIYWISSGIISSIVSLITGIGALFSTLNISPQAGMLASFLNIFSSVFFIVFYIAVALQYFNLVEQKEGTGMLNRIDRIGTDKNDFNNIEEQF